MATRVVIAVLCAALAACTSSDDSITPILNGNTSATLTTSWSSQQPCVVPFGGGSCSTGFGFAIAADGTAKYFVEGGVQACANPGPPGWTKIGPAVIILNNVCGTQSLTLTAIAGSVSDGMFTADVSGYHNNVFTIGSPLSP